MKRMIRYLFLLFLIVQGTEASCLLSQESGQPREWPVSQARSFDTLAINAYKADPAFRYGSVRQFNESIWSRIKRWFWNKMDKLFGTEGTLTGMILFFSFLFLGVIALVYYITRVRGISPFHKADRHSGVHEELFDKEIEPEDLDRKIRDAKSKNDYRSAVRYLTIRMFNELERAGFLEKDPSTTMEQYRKQLKHSRVSSHFDPLTRYFEFVWYGEYALGTTDFTKIEQRFEHFSAHMKTVS